MASGHTSSLSLPIIGGKIQKPMSGRFKKARRKADLTPNRSTQLLTINSATSALKRSSRTTDHSCKVPQTPPLDNGIKCGYAYCVSVPRKFLTLFFFLWVAPIPPAKVKDQNKPAQLPRIPYERQYPPDQSSVLRLFPRCHIMVRKNESITINT